jgi:hypothetical protein
MKNYLVNIVISYEIEAESIEDAKEQAVIEFSEDSHPDYEIRVEYSWPITD